MHPNDPEYATIECGLALKLSKVKKDYATLLSQRAKLKCLTYGDDNTTIFHRSISQRQVQNIINFLVCNDTLVSDPVLIKDAFYDY